MRLTKKYFLAASFCREMNKKMFGYSIRGRQ